MRLCCHDCEPPSLKTRRLYTLVSVSLSYTIAVLKAELDDLAVSGDGSIILALIKTEKGDLVPIAIDAAQAQTIAMGQSGEQFDRPLTHDLILSIVEMLNANIVRVEITELRDEVFYAKLVIENRGIEFDIDTRPSDALALAVRIDAPLFVAEQVVEQNGFTDDFDLDLDGPSAEA